MFRRAAALATEHRIESDADLGPFLQSPALASSVPPEVLRRLEHMSDAGTWVLLESAIADLPIDLRWLFESGAVTLDALAALHRALGVTTAADVAASIEAEQLRRVAGVDARIEAAVGEALPQLRTSVPRVPLGRATALAEPLLGAVTAAPGVSWAAPSGSLRRGQDTVGDIELVAAATDPAPALARAAAAVEGARVLHRSARRLYVMIDRAQLGVRLPDPAQAGAVLLYTTGSRRHVDELRALARERGGRLTIDGLEPASGPRVAASEEDIYSALGLPFIPPEIRDGGDELSRARAGTLPVLVSRADIRGDLHMHTTWSDGRDSIEVMAAQCRDLGYEYCAITDHSPHSAASRSLSIDDIKRQADEIATVRERFPELTILHGCEVDILPDGRLDLPDRVLERLDIVLASLHERSGQGPEHLMRRYAAAMRHPLVHVITHPTNRMLPHRPGYDLDYDRLFETARETRTILEIDGAPAHLDLDGALARRAIALGVTVVVDSDSHRADVLDRQMRMGLATARRGWAEPRHVANTVPLTDLRALMQRKRA